MNLTGKNRGPPQKKDWKELLQHLRNITENTGVVLSRGSWKAVKQQNKKADTVEKTAAKEHEASVQYIFRGTFSIACSLKWMDLRHDGRPRFLLNPP